MQVWFIKYYHATGARFPTSTGSIRPELWRLYGVKSIILLTQKKCCRIRYMLFWRQYVILKEIAGFRHSFFLYVTIKLLIITVKKSSGKSFFLKLPTWAC